MHIFCPRTGGGFRPLVEGMGLGLGLGLRRGLVGVAGV